MPMCVRKKLAIQNYEKCDLIYKINLCIIKILSEMKQIGVKSIYEIGAVNLFVVYL